MFGGHCRKYGGSSGEHRLESGESTDLLNYTWIPELGPLRNYMIGNTTTISSMKVAEMVMNNVQWNWSRLQRLFNGEVLDFISACHPPSEVLGNDCCLWKLNSSGKFSIKSAYFKMGGKLVSRNLFDWMGVWN
ncbi:hypothetical protein PVK06_000995 [Gossypium arboreum]|uniref:Uncharacterized protein n=1 Tax=Gossypium arboreum TaxID=29729 RepID=A0ABR0QZX1_GOSAR|nr:hypothetical protein PVK06_000995 [Gossypium arboreum]